MSHSGITTLGVVIVVLVLLVDELGKVRLIGEKGAKEYPTLQERSRENQSRWQQLNLLFTAPSSASSLLLSHQHRQYV